MNDFNIQDAQLLLEQAGYLNQCAQNIARVQEDLALCSSEISKAWQSDTVDKSSYLSKLDSNLNKVNILVSAIVTLSNSLSGFANSAINVSNGGNGGIQNISTVYGPAMVTPNVDYVNISTVYGPMTPPSN